MVRVVEGGTIEDCEADPVGRVMVKVRVVFPGEPRTLSCEKDTFPLTELATLPERDWFEFAVPAKTVIEFASRPCGPIFCCQRSRISNSATMELSEA